MSRDTIGLWLDGKTLLVLFVELTYCTTLQIFKVSVTVSAVKNMSFAKEETCWWQKTDSATWKRWHTGTDTEFTFTATDSNTWTDLQINRWLCLIGMLLARSGIDDLRGWGTLEIGLLVAVANDLDDEILILRGNGL